MDVQLLAREIRVAPHIEFIPSPELEAASFALPHGTRHEPVFRPAEALTLGAYRLTWRLEFPAGAPLRVHHHTLPRMHREMTLTADRKLGGEGLPRTGFSSPGNYDLPSGHQDMALHNAFVAFRPGGPAWLLAPLSEDRSKAGFTWELRDERTLDVSVEFSFPGLPGWAVGAGASFAGETLFEQSFPAPFEFGPEAFDTYHAVLLARGGLGRAKAGPTARHEVFWGTWNEGIYSNIDEGMILREARWVARNLPNVRWIQIDAGFQKDADRNNLAEANVGGHWDAGAICCERRLPRGMRALTEDIRALGLRPMVWFSPSCSKRGPLFQTHPEYFHPDSELHFEKNLVFPDFSQPPVRDLVRRSLDRLLVEWGYEGMKLDFWTYGFEQTRMKLRHHQASNLEWLQWLEQEIRLRLPADGLMLSCLEPANGNPFRSAVWDQHRIGPDIDGVNPGTLEEIAVWMAALVGLKQTQRHFWTPEADGLSLFRHSNAPDERARLFTAFMVVTGSATELAGKLSEQEDDPRMAGFKRAVALIRLGQRVTCPGYNWTDNAGRAPGVWLRHDLDGRRVVGFTNWSGEPQTLTLPGEDAAGEWTNALTNERTSSLATRTLAPGDGELWVREP